MLQTVLTHGCQPRYSSPSRGRSTLRLAAGRRDPAGARNRQHGPFGRIVAVHRGDMDDVPRVDEAVARVRHERHRIGFLTGQQVEDGCGRHFAMLVRHMSRFRHLGRRKGVVADDMDARRAGRFTSASPPPPSDC